MPVDTPLSRLLARIKKLDTYVLTCITELKSVPVADRHVPVVVTGRILNVISAAFELDSRAEYMISMELNPKLVQLRSVDTDGIKELLSLELDILDRIHTDLDKRAESARRELASKGNL